MRTTHLRKAAIGLAFTAILASGAGAQAEHVVLQADHAPQAAVIAGEPLHVRVGAGTSCVVAQVCSWVQATVSYELDGEPTRAWVEGPYQAAQVLVVTIPAEHIAGTTFEYTIDVTQQGCYGDCHEHTVHLPRLGLERYSVEVLGG